MIVGFIAGAFDIIHPGYVSMFREAKQHCNYLVVGLHENPEANGKVKPILSTKERTDILSSLVYVDGIRIYKGEDGLYQLLQEIKPDIRFLGTDYVGKKHTGEDLGIPVHYVDRSHGWSTTKLKHLIHDSFNNI